MRCRSQHALVQCHAWSFNVVGGDPVHPVLRLLLHECWNIQLIKISSTIYSNDLSYGLPWPAWLKAFQRPIGSKSPFPTCLLHRSPDFMISAWHNEWGEWYTVRYRVSDRQLSSSFLFIQLSCFAGIRCCLVTLWTDISSDCRILCHKCYRSARLSVRVKLHSVLSTDFSLACFKVFAKTFLALWNLPDLLRPLFMPPAVKPKVGTRRTAVLERSSKRSFPTNPFAVLLPDMSVRYATCP